MVKGRQNVYHYKVMCNVLRTVTRFALVCLLVLEGVCRAAPSEEEDADQTFHYWGVGLVTNGYSGPHQSSIQEVEAVGVTSHASYSFDLFGVYRGNHEQRVLVGFVMNQTMEMWDTGTTDLSIIQNLYALSSMYFFGFGVGDGYFIRGDIGLAHYLRKGFPIGIGLTVGGGWALPLSFGPRLMFGLYYGVRSTSEFGTSSLSANIGIIF